MKYIIEDGIVYVMSYLKIKQERTREELGEEEVGHKIWRKLEMVQMMIGAKLCRLQSFLRVEFFV